MDPPDVNGAPQELESTEQLLERFGRRHAVLARGVGGLVAATVAPLVDAPISRTGMLVISVGLIIWTATFVVRMWRMPVRRLTLADAAIVAALSLAVPLVDSRALVADHNGWVIVVVTMTIVSVQWHQPPRVAWGISFVLAAAYFIGGAVATTPATVAHPTAWMLVGGALSALAWGLVTREGRTADALTAQELAATRDADVASARRADQRRHWAAVHDTAATTLLMIGNGEVRDDAVWLTAQLERDIEALDGSTVKDAVGVDLVAALRAAIGRDTTYTLEATDEPIAPRRVADALAGAVSEAVENVRRHSGGAEARITVAQTAVAVVVEIADDGHGFDANAPSAGRGLHWSIIGRLRSIGGNAEIDSVVGRGTTVRLEWAHD